MEARIPNLPKFALGKSHRFPKIQDGRHYSIQNFLKWLYLNNYWSQRLKFGVKSDVYNVNEFIEVILRMLHVCLIIMMKMLMLTYNSTNT